MSIHCDDPPPLTLTKDLQPYTHPPSFQIKRDKMIIAVSITVPVDPADFPSFEGQTYEELRLLIPSSILVSSLPQSCIDIDCPWTPFLERNCRLFAELNSLPWSCTYGDRFVVIEEDEVQDDDDDVTVDDLHPRAHVYDFNPYATRRSILGPDDGTCVFEETRLERGYFHSGVVCTSLPYRLHVAQVPLSDGDAVRIAEGAIVVHKHPGVDSEDTGTQIYTV